MMMGSTGVSSHPGASGSSGSCVPFGDADRCIRVQGLGIMTQGLDRCMRQTMLHKDKHGEGTTDLRQPRYATLCWAGHVGHLGIALPSWQTT